MKVIQPTGISKKTIVTLDETVTDSVIFVGPIVFPEMHHGLAFRKDVSVIGAGQYEVWPDDAPYLSASAYWDGSNWQGAQPEIDRCSKPGYARKLDPSTIGTWDNQVWAEPTVVARNLTSKAVKVHVEHAPMGILRTEGCRDCDFVIYGSANESRIHGSYPAVYEERGDGNRYLFMGVECPGQLMSVNKTTGAPTEIAGYTKCLSHLGDAGGVYVHGRGADVQGQVITNGLYVHELLRAYPASKPNGGLYLDDFTSGNDAGYLTTHGFEYSVNIGGGSNNDCSRVVSLDGKGVWLDDRSGQKEVGRYAGRPLGNSLP